MKKSNLFTLGLLFFCSLIFSQDFFTKIESGMPVEDPGKSYGNSFIDFDNDGDEDIFICNLYDDQPNVLYVNQGDGTFTIDTGILSDESVQSIAASWGDYDNDGNADLYVANVGSELQNNFFYSNNGDGTFTKITEGVMVTDAHWSISCSWVDYDNDGWLDMFVANFDGPNDLYHNNGDGTFSAITTGEIVTENGASFGCAWADYDNDGWQDLFVANNYFDALPAHNNTLFHNNGDGTFTKITEGDLVNDGVESHGASWGDYNNDGWVDLFITNHDWNINKKNFLYENNGDGTFTRVYDSALEADENTSYGSSWLDVDYDGDLDLYYSNNRSGQRQNGLFINNADGSFTRNVIDPSTLDEYRSHGCASGDINNDGYPDLFTASFSTSHNNGLYVNNGSENNWVGFKLIGVYSNKSAIGARIEIEVNNMIQTRQITAQTGFYSQNSLKQYFGLGSETTISSITIYWPSGIVQDVSELEINQLHTIIEAENEDLLVPQNLFASDSGLLIWDAPVTRDFIEYKIYLDGVEQGTTTALEFQLENLENGNEYTASVSAIYTGGESELVNIVFQVETLAHPLNLSISETNLLTWEAPATREFIEYKVYLDGNELSTTTELEYQLVDLEANTEYTVAVSAIYTTGESELLTLTFTTINTSMDDTNVVSSNFQLWNYPNPFNPETTIKYQLKDFGNVHLAIYNVKGQLIKTLVNEHQTKGNYTVVWSGNDNNNNSVSSGIYYYKIESNGKIFINKMILMK